MPTYKKKMKHIFLDLQKKNPSVYKYFSVSISFDKCCVFREITKRSSLFSLGEWISIPSLQIREFKIVFRLVFYLLS